MKTFFIVATIALAAVLLSIAGLAVKTLVLKNGELKRHCAAMDPYSGNRAGCICAGRSASCSDRKSHPYQPLDVNDNLMNEINPNL